MKAFYILACIILCCITVNAAHKASKPLNAADDAQDFRFLIFREDCFKEFTNLNFNHEDCVSITMSKLLGYLIILGSTLVKFPQVYNIIKTGSGDGILPSMFYTESYMYIINGCYNVHLGSPFSVYGENFLLLAQNIIIIILLWYYSKGTSFLTKFTVSLSMGSMITYLFMDSLVPDYVWMTLMNAQILMIAVSRVPQILENYNNGSTGQLALITFVMNLAGNLARTFTLLKESNDLLNILSAVVGALFNATITFQIIYYWNSPVQKVKVEKDDGGSDDTQIKRKTNQEKETPRARKVRID